MSSKTVGLDKSEILLWTIMRSFESLALQQYQLYLPVLATPEKKELLALLNLQVDSDEALDGTSLQLPVQDLIANATKSDVNQTLIIQGLMLELLAQVIYQTFEKNEMTSPATSQLCVVGLKASKINSGMVPDLILQKIGDGEQLLQVLISSSRDMLKHLDALGEGIDQNFEERFKINFADLMGEFASELIPVCTELGVDRRKLVGYLTSALMGI